MNLERQAERLEETVKNVRFFNLINSSIYSQMFTFGEFKLDFYSDYLDSITKEQMQNKVK